jgi:hypothetical protein
MLGLFICASPAQEKIEAAKILEKSTWMDIYQAFDVSTDSLSKIKGKLPEKLHIDVYFAFWCGDSEVNVPKFMRLVDLLNDNRIQVTYYITDRKASRQVKYYVESLKVERIPTFIFYHGKKEMGRIIENPQENLIKDFLSILK